MNERKNTEKEANQNERKAKRERGTAKVVQTVVPRDSEINFVDEDRSLLVQGSFYYLHSFEHLLFFEPPPYYLHA